MSFDFNMDTDKVESGDRAPTLNYPYLGWGYFQKCEFVEVVRNEGKDNETRVWTLEFHLELEGDTDREGGLTEKGTLHIHREKPVGDPTNTTKIQNQVNRVGYIMSKLVGMNNAKAALGKVEKADTYADWWQNFGKLVSAVMKNAVAKTSITKNRIKMKMVGTVFTGDSGLVGYVAFTKYLGFMSDGNKPLVFGKNEIQGNDRYMRYLSSGSNGGDSNTTFDANFSAGGAPMAPNFDAVDGLDI